MAFSQNPNGPRGLTPLRAQNGPANRSGEYEILGTYATKVYSGNPVILAADGTIQVPANQEDDILGVFDGVQYIDTAGNVVFSPFWPAPGAVQTGSKVKARVFDNPDEVFLIKADADLVLAAVGEFFDVTALSGGDDVTGKSSQSLAVASRNAAAANQMLRLRRIAEFDGTVQLAEVQFIRPALSQGQNTVA